jgi:hypothetical protein
VLRHPLTLLIVAVLVTACAIAGVASAGAGVHPGTLLLDIVANGFDPALGAGLWLLAALGWGRLARPLFAGTSDPLDRKVLHAASGLAIALLLTLLAATFGLLRPVPVLVITLTGLALLMAHRPATYKRWKRSLPSPRPAHALLAIPATLLLMAATIPPGATWASEGFAYDVRSYHLQLPREWIAAGRVEPLEHNVYSYLPSGMESAYASLAVARMAPAVLLTHAVAPGSRVLDEWAAAHAEPTFADMVAAIASGDGLAAISCAHLHALTTILAACAIGLLARRLGARALPAALLALATPWTIVVGSLAYNESAVLLIFAAALLAAISRDITPARRGALVGLLMGAACLAKPTAMFMCVPGCALALATHIPRRSLVPAFAWASVVGLAALAPWLARNWLAAGNPVFPSATSLFGLAHWTPEQLARWNAGHHPPIAPLDRLARLANPRFGLTHPQWSITPWLGLLGLLAARLARPTARAAALLAAVLALQLLAWLVVGHLQSRFLLPALVPLVAGFALGAQRLTERRPKHAGHAIPATLALLVALHAAIIALRQPGNAFLAAALGPGLFNGSILQTADDPAALGSLGPIPHINRLPGEYRHVLLVGDATPLYLDADVRVTYSTTWDAHPLADALRATNGDLFAATQSVRESLGVSHLLINLAELDRLHRSGWLDPALAPEPLIAQLNGAPTTNAWPDAAQLLVPTDPDAWDAGRLRP